MIICSIDLIGGKAVQLERGERLVIEREDVLLLAERFGRCGEIAVIDLDAARGTGENRELIEQLCKVARCRVGGGIRDAEIARAYLRAGAHAVILGTAASPELLSELPRDRTIVALDARNGRVATHGWRVLTDDTPLARAKILEPYCGGFLFTNIDREGMLGGVDLAQAEVLREAVSGSITVAGGIRSVEEITELDKLNVDAQVGMALYTGLIDPADAVVATIDFAKSGGLVPTVACDLETGRPLMLAYSNEASLRAALREGAGIYWSRSRAGLWRKGETSGHTQALARVAVDCDRDSLVFYVRQAGAACHDGSERCFDPLDFSWAKLLGRIASRSNGAGSNSYTARLLSDETFLAEKIMEEAAEVVRAQTPEEVAWECADLLYFMSVKMHRSNVGIPEVMAQLASRAKG